MGTLRSQRPRNIENGGAEAGSVLFGAVPANQGLQLRISQAQVERDGRPLKGSFVILDVGDNKHTDALFNLLGKVTDAAEVLAVIRERSKGCVSVVNRNVLALEETHA
jgi:hypothetical protein